MFLTLAIISTLSSEQLLIFSNSSFSIFWSPGMATSTMRHFLLACLVNNSHIRSVMFNDLVSLGLIYPTFSGLWSYKLLTTSNPSLLARTPQWKWEHVSDRDAACHLFVLASSSHLRYRLHSLLSTQIRLYVMIDVLSDRIRVYCLVLSAVDRLSVFPFKSPFDDLWLLVPRFLCLQGFGISFKLSTRWHSSS